MLRRLFTAASALSLLLCIATAGLWVWSDVQPVGPIRLATLSKTKFREGGLGRGYVAVSTMEMVSPMPNVGAGYPYGGDSSGWDVMGLHWRRSSLTIMDPKDRKVLAVLNRSATFVVWLGWPVLLSAILPAWWLVRKRKLDREKRKGMCKVCGYDLRASQERCPECGSPIPSVPA